MSRLNIGDAVKNRNDVLGLVVDANAYMVKVQFNNGNRPGWFDRDDDDRLTLVKFWP